MPRIALVHDWIVNIGGAEKCLQELDRIYPHSGLFTLLARRQSIGDLNLSIGSLTQSAISRLPNAAKWYPKYLPLFPYAIEMLDLKGYDLILSSSHAVAKNVLTRSDQLHICYCHTPMRYAWELTHQYTGDRGLSSWLKQYYLHHFRNWDQGGSNRVDAFIANSKLTAGRIWRAYRREAQVIYPPVDVERFDHTRGRQEYFVFISRLVPYKKADLVVEAFAQNGLPLKVIGAGEQLSALHRRASSNIEIMGWQPDEAVANLLEQARALIFAAEEDFGIIPVEAQAAGAPVIAFGQGGVTETVVPLGATDAEPTGVFFNEQTVESLNQALSTFLAHEQDFDRNALRRQAESFSSQRFRSEIKDFVDGHWS